MKFSRILLDWYEENKRDLPWRRTRDPYRIWVSEIILQQTRVEQGLAYYERFLERFPDIKSLAAADEEQVIRIWQGLGYYSRARNMHASAKKIAKEKTREFPANYSDLIKMKGIGDYSASAIASIAFGESNPAIDGNVIRVMSRYVGITGNVKSTSAKKKIKNLLEKLIDRQSPGDFNQALMELGAIVCKKADPACHSCPLQKGCYAFKNGLTKEIPASAKYRRPVARFLHYLVIFGNDGKGGFVWIKKRTGKGIWKNLYDFPGIEDDHELSYEELQQCREWEELTGNYVFSQTPVIKADRHLLSHRELRVKFFIINANDFSHPNYKKVGLDSLYKYPLPRLIERFLEKFSTDRVFFHNLPINK
jgi:A/G-specific adenine glycosylase